MAFAGVPAKLCPAATHEEERMAEPRPAKQARKATTGARKTSTAKRGRSSGGSAASTPASSATTSDPANPLGLEPDHFTPPAQPVPAETGVEELYERPAPELVEWTPERAGNIVRGFGYLAHIADPVSSEPEAADLWKATQDDIEAIGPPLSRILNRYEPARRLAGVSDEAELAFGMIAYARSNLATRGRALTAKRQREQEAAEPEPGTWPPSPS
jgi:hypothetical protein